MKKQYDKQKKVINAPQGYQKIRVHLVFAVKYDGRHKARLVADGHLTPEPVESIYSGVVSLRNLKLVIFLGKLNDLELWGADIGNAYLEAPTEEKLYSLVNSTILSYGEQTLGMLILKHQQKKSSILLLDLNLRIGKDTYLLSQKFLEKNDHPELDTSEILEGQEVNHYYLTMVGQLQWLITLGRFDIQAQVITMSRFRALPRKGHLDRLKRIYAYVIRTKDYATRFRTTEPDYSYLPDQNFD